MLKCYGNTVLLQPQQMLLFMDMKNCTLRAEVPLLICALHQLHLARMCDFKTKGHVCYYHSFYPKMLLMYDGLPKNGDNTGDLFTAPFSASHCHYFMTATLRGDKLDRNQTAPS